MLHKFMLKCTIFGLAVQIQKIVFPRGFFLQIILFWIQPFRLNKNNNQNVYLALFFTLKVTSRTSGQWL